MRASSVPQPEPAPRPRRRTVLAGAAVARRGVGSSGGGGSHGRSPAAEDPAAPLAHGGDRWDGLRDGHPVPSGRAGSRVRPHGHRGAYRWDDRGSRWTALTDHIGWDDWNLLGVEAMAVDPAHPDRLYLALGTYAQEWASPGAVLRSDDRGRTWARTDLTVRLGANEDGRGCGERLLVDPRDSETLWLGTRHDGLLRSRDRGATWAADTSFPATASAGGQGVTLLVAAGRTVYAGWGTAARPSTAGPPPAAGRPYPGSRPPVPRRRSRSARPTTPAAGRCT